MLRAAGPSGPGIGCPGAPLARRLHPCLSTKNAASHQQKRSICGQPKIVRAARFRACRANMMVAFPLVDGSTRAEPHGPFRMARQYVFIVLNHEITVSFLAISELSARRGWAWPAGRAKARPSFVSGGFPCPFQRLCC